MKTGRDPAAIFKIDAYDERFLSSSVVTFGLEKFAGGFRPIFQDSKCCILYNKNGAITPICGSMLHFVQHFGR